MPGNRVRRETDPFGVQLTWVDARDEVATVPEPTVGILHGAIGEPPADIAERIPIVTRPGRDLGLGAVEVRCEDGRTVRVDGALADDFPLGYHTVRMPSGRERPLIVSPGRCWLPEGWRAWGWAVQVYAIRSRNSWGIGDLGDLRAVREWAEGLGAGFLLVNPLHAVAPTLPQEASPYLPSSRRFLNPLYLSVAQVPGAHRVDLTDLHERGRALNDEPLIDRDAVWALKREALWRIFTAGPAASRPGSRGGGGGFEAWRAERGEGLQQFAMWSALAEKHGPCWRDWDPALHDPHGAAVQEFAAERMEVVDFFAWLQWLVAAQLREATGSMTVVQDLPVGVDGGGFDAWTWQHVLADDVTVGAPPDIFNEAGQTWGSPPMVPWRLQSADYRPFIELIRGTIAGAGGLRIDHVMGLFRLWWVPREGSAVDGAYVRYPSDDLLDIVALESNRAQAIVIGEDLGTVEKGVREALADRGLLSYRLLWFERKEPSTWPPQSLAAVTTHDLPTVAGLWSGSDVEEQLRYMDTPREKLDDGRDRLLKKLRGRPGLAAGAGTEAAVKAAYRRLAQAPSTLLSATLEDAVASERRPNLPGVTSRPNWCLPLPVAVEDLPGHALARAVAEALADRG